MQIEFILGLMIIIISGMYLIIGHSKKQRNIKGKTESSVVNKIKVSEIRMTSDIKIPEQYVKYYERKGDYHSLTLALGGCYRFWKNDGIEIDVNPDGQWFKDEYKPIAIYDGSRCRWLLKPA